LIIFALGCLRKVVASFLYLSQVLGGVVPVMRSFSMPPVFPLRGFLVRAFLICPARLGTTVPGGSFREIPELPAQEWEIFVFLRG